MHHALHNWPNSADFDVYTTDQVCVNSLSLFLPAIRCGVYGHKPDVWSETSDSVLADNNHGGRLAGTGETIVLYHGEISLTATFTAACFEQVSMPPTNKFASVWLSLLSNLVVSSETSRVKNKLPIESWMLVSSIV